MLGIWEPGELVNSNNNLLEVDFKREDGEYVVRERARHHSDQSFLFPATGGRNRGGLVRENGAIIGSSQLDCDQI